MNKKIIQAFIASAGLMGTISCSTVSNKNTVADHSSIRTNRSVAQTPSEDDSDVLPDFKVPKVDFSSFNKTQQNIDNALKAMTLASTSTKPDQNLGVSVPDYKPAHDALVASMSATLSQFQTALEKIEANAEEKYTALKKLQQQYSNEIKAIENARDQYQGSRKVLGKTLDVEKEKRKKSISDAYADLINSVKTEYAQAINDLVAQHTDAAKLSNSRSPNFLHAVENGIVTPFLAVAAAVLWAAPVPYVVSIQAIAAKDVGESSNVKDEYNNYKSECKDDESLQKVQDCTFWGMLQPVKDAVRTNPDKTGYATAIQDAKGLYAACKTSACVYAIEGDLEVYMKELAKLDAPLKVGRKKVKPGQSLKLNYIKTVLRNSADLVARDGRNTVEFTPTN